MRQIEYFYSAHSAYAYIGARRLMEICEVHDCRLVHKPIELSPVVEAVSGLPFGRRSRAHLDYFFGREIERWAEYRDMPIISHRPTHHDNPLHLSNGMLIAATLQGADADRLAYSLLEAHWRDDIDLADREALSVAAGRAGVDPAPLLDAALGEEAQAIHKANGEEAVRRNVFGSPTYFLDGDMFYGQDHLELLEHALTTPFAPQAYQNP